VTFDSVSEANEPGRTHLTRRRLSLGLALQLCIRVLGLLLGLVVAGALARGLGHGGFGLFSLILSIIAIAAAVVEFGMTATSIRYISVTPDMESRVAGALVAFRSLAGILSFILLLVTVKFSTPSEQAARLALVLGIVLLISPLFALQPIGQARLRIGAQNILLLCQSAVWAIAVLVLYTRSSGLWQYGWAFVIANLFLGCLSWLLYRQGTAVAVAGALPTMRKLLKLAWPVAIASIFVTSYYRIDSVLLVHIRGLSENANYAAAYRFLDSLQFLPATLAAVILPLLAATSRVDSVESGLRRNRIFKVGLKFIIAAALPVVVGTTLLAKQLVGLVYGPGFEQAAPLLAILIWSFPSICIGYLAVSLTLALNETRRYAVVTAIAAVFNVAANWMLIPHFGATAACWITVITEYSVSVTLFILLARSSNLSVPWGAWIRVAVATACMALVVIVLRYMSLSVSIPVGGAVYLLVVLLLRVISREDVRMLLSRDSVA